MKTLVKNIDSNVKMFASLDGKSIFLGGPIQYALSKNEFDHNLKKLILSVYSILRSANIEVLSAHKVEEFGLVDTLNQFEKITIRDFTWMNDCDAYICLIPKDPTGSPYRSDGTCIELGWASALKVPTIIIRSMDCTYSHLIEGLHSISTITYLPIDQATDKNILLSSLEMTFQHLQLK